MKYIKRKKNLRLMKFLGNFYLFFGEVPLDRESPPQEPDFILTTTTSKRVGIELTEVFHPNSAKQQSSVKDQVTKKLVETLCNRLPYRFTINVFIDPVRTIRKSGMNELNGQLAEICVREFATLENNGWGEVEHVDFDLITPDPQIFARIHENGYHHPLLFASSRFAFAIPFRCVLPCQQNEGCDPPGVSGRPELVDNSWHIVSSARPLVA